MVLIAQIFGLLALICMSLGYQQKKKKGFLFLQIFSNLFYGIQYLFLNAYSALATCIISLIRTIIFYKNEVNKKENHYSILLILFLIIIIVGIISYQTWYSVIPIFIALLFTYGVWQKKLSTSYKIGVVVSILWIIYNLIVKAYVGAFGACIELVSSIIGYIKIKQTK